MAKFSDLIDKETQWEGEYNLLDLGNKKVTGSSVVGQYTN